MKKFNLEDHPKEHIFRTPSGYFEGLPDKIQQRIAAEEQAKGKVVHLQPGIKTYSWAAAVALLAMLAAAWLFDSMTTERALPQSSLSFEELSKDEIRDYLLMEDLESGELLELASEKEIELKFFPEEELRLSPELLDQMMDLEDIEEYL